MHDSQVLAMITGQYSQSEPSLSTIMQVLQSGKPGVSAMRKGSLHSADPALRREPSTTTSSAERSPEPRYQETSNSPSSSSTIPGAWLCLASSGKMSSALNSGD